MNLDLTGKRAFVCGSTQGLGKACAVELALLGCSVTLIARNGEALLRTRDELHRSSAQEHDYIVADFNHPGVLKERVADYLSTKNPVHILVNNSGGPPPGTILDARPEEFTAAFAQHLICNQILVQAVVPGMRSAGYGRIINIISTSVKQPIPGLGVSNTIRGAVASWAKTLATELAPYGITVNNVLPGMTRTQRLESLIKSKAEKTGKTIEQVTQEMIEEIPMGRIAMPHEFAAAVAFLASPAASYITGMNLPVDGGRTLCL